ncbi:MAG: hypothetical protein OQK58_08900 [Gammaproteobacteria bacterium]|nr:hypothetical protein [Gammaproteobacteria bacterium]
MKNYIKIITLSIGLIIGTPALAASPTDVFSNCLVDALNGKERKNLAKWIFFAIAAHPDITSYSKASTKDINDSDKYVGKLITKLLTADCSNELNNARKSNPRAIEQGFGLVGKVAMQELMTNQNVTKAISNYIKYADQEKINQVLLKK